MKILQIFEWIATGLIIIGVIGSLGAIAVEQVVYMATHSVHSACVVAGPSEHEKAAYMAELRTRADSSSRHALLVMEARARGGRQ